MQKLSTGRDASGNTVTDIRKHLKELAHHCQNYKGGDAVRSAGQFSVTLVLFLILCGAMFFGFKHGYWLSALLWVPAAGLLVRLFIMQHDCGHRSFFPSRRANDFVGRFISLLTFTPYDYWRRAHNIHHAGSGNLDRRGAGAIDTITVREYQALSPGKRFLYRLYRNPFILLVLGTPLYIIVIQRFPFGDSIPHFEEYHAVSFSKAWPSVMALNGALALVYGGLAMLVGWKLLLLVYLPVLVMTSWVGGWLFFIQHQFEEAYWEHNEDWDFNEAAVMGSSYYVLPKILQWFTGNIGLHHIHHLCSSIPNYRLQECMEGNQELQNMNRMTFMESLQCLWWVLWDEDQRKMVSFREYRAA